MDDDLPHRKNDALQLLMLQSLDSLSVTELNQRIQYLTAEIERTQQHLTRAGHVKADAEALFRK